MRYIDVEIVSDRALSSAQVEFCVSELCKAIGAPTGVIPASVSADECDDGDGMAYGSCGNLFYCSDQHHFHRVELSATNRADLNAIVLILCTMCAEGCEVYYDGDSDNTRDRLDNFSYKLSQI